MQKKDDTSGGESMSVRDSTSNKTILWVNIAFSGTFFVVIFAAIFFLSAKISHLEIENSSLKTEKEQKNDAEE